MKPLKEKNKMLKNIVKTKIVCLLFLASVSTYSQPFGGGSGTSTDPYKIYILEHLIELSDSIKKIGDFSNKHFYLMNDITDSLREPIGFRGSGNSPGVFISGSFNSQGHSVNLAIEDFHSGGLFSEINNTIIMNVVINGYIRGAGLNGAGGVVGKISQNSKGPSKIMNCINNACIMSDGLAGGIIGVVYYEVVVENCINLGTIGIMNNFPPAMYKGVGGILGSDNSFLFSFMGGGTSVILNNSNYGFVNGGGYDVGGIIGHSINNTIISNNSNFGVVLGTKNVGCIIAIKGTNTILINNHYDKQMCGEED